MAPGIYPPTDPRRIAQNLDLAIDVKRDYGASGSTQSTTGSITAGQATLTVASAIDFEVGQGISVAGAGPVSTLATPSAPTVAPGGIAGTTTYGYVCAAIDRNGALTAASPAGTTTTGNATLSPSNYNQISVPAGSGAVAYAWWRTASGGSPTTTGFIGTTGGTTIYDSGLPVLTPPAGIPASPPASATGGVLLTTVSAIAGTTITLSGNASTSINNATVYHDDSAAILNAINAAPTGGAVYLPAGTYRVALGIAMPNKNVAILGDGYGASILVSSGLGAHILSSATSQQVLIRGVQFQTNGAESALYWSVPSTSSVSPSLMIEECQFIGSATATGSLCYFQYLREFTIGHCIFQGSTSSPLGVYAAVFLKGTINATIQASIIYQCIIGVFLDGTNTSAGVQGTRLDELLIIGGVVGVYANGGSSGCHETWLTSCIVDYVDVGVNAFDIDGLYAIDSYIAGQSAANTGNQANGQVVNGKDLVVFVESDGSAPVRNILVKGCRIVAYNFQNVGLQVQGYSSSYVASGIIVSDSFFIGFNLTSLYLGHYTSHASILNCQFTSATTNGSMTHFGVASTGMSDISLRDCQFADHPPSSIQYSWINASGNSGYNPVGLLTAPAVPASGTPQANTFGVRVRVAVSGGSLTNIAINGTNTGLTSGMFELDPGETITLTYTAAPTWTWFGL
jgi:hypothetical protein